MVNLTPHKDTLQQESTSNRSSRKSGRESYRKGTVSSRRKETVLLSSERSTSNRSKANSRRKTEELAKDELWEEQRKKSVHKHGKMTELMRAKQIFGALRDQHHAKHSNMFKAFQAMDTDLNSEGHGTLKFDPFYKALQGLYFDRLVSKQEAHEIFDLVDHDKSGSIDFVELQQAFDYATGALGEASLPGSITPKEGKPFQSPKKKVPVSVDEATHDMMTVKAKTVLTDAEMIEKKLADKRLNELKYRILDKVCQKHARKSIAEALRIAYIDADVNQDGNLSYEEFADWLGDGPTGLSLGFNDKDIRDITLACDKDLDGGIDCQEFISTIARRDRPDPRSFLNECRETELAHMQNEKKREIERMHHQIENPRIPTPKVKNGELSTRVWYTNDIDPTYLKPEDWETSRSKRSSGSIESAGSNKSNSSFKITLSPLKGQHNEEASNLSCTTNAENEHDQIEQGPELTKGRTENEMVLSYRKNRLRSRKSNSDTNILNSMQQNLKQHVYHKTLNPGMVSRLNFEDFGKLLPLKRPDKGQAYKPVWANRLTFDRIGLGSGGIDKTSSMYASDQERLQEITKGNNTNLANKFCLRERLESVKALKLVRKGKRDFLARQKGQLRRRIHQRTRDQESADLSRIRSKTFQRMRFLENMQEVEEFHVRTSYNTKGLIKSPIAARNQAGSICFFRPPSPRGRRIDNLQTGIGQRDEAIVDWRF
jgi:Ca2+-binding EF-hand superfamily protein